MSERNVVLVCGSHKSCDVELIYKTLDKLHKKKPITLLVQGYAKFTDRTAHEWAVKRKVPSTGSTYQITEEMWTKHGRGAGHIRNARMRDYEKPDLVVAFPGGPGTANMVTIAKHVGIRIKRVKE